ncbi:hypothetical protein LBMAG42_06800 [Deltaproteobacteria bacterium]|nr:hypothetical protein LBMAG42_06800 [Deltaproteobacteria bacterium]
MDAFFARNRLSAYLDGELSAAEAREVEAALAQDPLLRRELDELRHAVEMLHDSGLVEPPAGFADRLAARLESEPMPVGWRRWVRQIRPEMVMLAAAALLVVVYVGNHKSLPDLDVPPDAPIVAGKAFDKAEEPAQNDAVVSAPAATDVAVAPGAPAPPSYGTAADGVLGNEPPAKQKMAPKQAGNPSDVPVDAWQPEWEKEPIAQAEGNTAIGAGNTANSADSMQVQWSSPPPFRYRVAASNDLALKKLAAIAKELGGELQDSRGRTLAAFQLERGQVSKFRVSVPAHNAAALAVRLRELGELTTVQETGNLLADPNSDIPVQVELSY